MGKMLAYNRCRHEVERIVVQSAVERLDPGVRDGDPGSMKNDECRWFGINRAGRAPGAGNR